MLWALALWAGVIAGFDLAVQRIPNWVLAAMLAPALAALALTGEGLLGVRWQSSVLGLGFGLLLTLPGYALGKLGAGDAKFAASLGFLLGVHAAVVCLLAAGLILGAVAATVWVADRNLQRRIAAAPALALAFAASLAGLLPAL